MITYMNSSVLPKEQPLVSVVIATYNRANDIMRAINSVRDQSYTNKEIIVVNDGSSDNTQHTLEQQSDIILINNKTNLRLQKSLNIGCNAARGKYIARLDDHDQWIDEEKLAKQVAFLEKNPDVAIVGTAAKSGERKIMNPLSDKDIRRQMLFRCPFCHITIVMRKEAFASVGGYDETLTYSEDWALWMKLGQKYQLANLSDVTTVISEETGLTNINYVSQYTTNRTLIKSYKNIYSGFLRAMTYHWSVRQFLRMFKLGGTMHKRFIRIYDYFFLRMQ